MDYSITNIKLQTKDQLEKMECYYKLKEHKYNTSISIQKQINFIKNDNIYLFINLPPSNQYYISYTHGENRFISNKFECKNVARKRIVK